jgi:exoribonuclease-2
MDIRLIPGQIIEFIEEGRIVTAVFLDEHKGRIRALTETQREVRLSPSRLVHVSSRRIPTNQPRERLVESLRDIAQKRDQLASQVDVKGLWEVLHEEADEYPLAELAELSFGHTAGDEERSAVLRAMLADRVYFRFRVHGFRPNDPQTVEKILIQRSREEEKERLIEQGSQWIRQLWSGQGGSPPQQWEQIVELLKEFAIYGKGAPRAKTCEQLLKRAGMTNPLAAFKVLVKLGIWPEDEDLLMHRFGTRKDFPAAVLQEAQQIADHQSLRLKEDSSRESLVELHCITIDSPQTLDIDDALSVEESPEGLQVGIHISDVSFTVPIGSALDREAALRGTSLYLPSMRIPMLPPRLSEDLLSLRSGELRPAVSLLLHVSPQGHILSHRFCLSWIRVRRRLTYDEADEMIASGDPRLRSLLDLARQLRQRRIQNGALLLPLPEVTVRVSHDGTIELERRDRESPSQILVSEMMILANRLAAQFLKEAGIPTIFRAQPEPRERVVEDALPDLFRSYIQRKLLNRAEYSLEPSFHHGLGVEFYTTLTSPIRRFLDLVMQRQFVATLRGEPAPYDAQSLEKLLMEQEEVLAQAAQLEQSGHRYWLLRYLEARPGMETRGLVLGHQGNRIQVLLMDFMIEASLPAASAPDLRAGQEVWVRITRARPREDELKIELS